MSRLTRDETAEPVSRDQILRHVRGQGNINFPCSADHEQDWQPYPFNPYSAICDDHTYIPLTLSLTSRLAPCARLTVDVPTRALWLAGIFLRRKKRCAGVVGTRTDWVLKGEEGGMTTPLLQYVARFDGGGEIFGFGGGGYKESWPWCSLFVGFPSLFVAPSGEKPALRFRPRAVVAGRGVVAVCTRISSQEHVYDK